MKTIEPVIVRVFKSGDKDVKKYGLDEVHISDMILVFPCDAGAKPHWCNSYSYIGQHGDCDYHRAILTYTRQATDSEINRMLTHYRQVYCVDVSLKVYKRWQNWFDVERRKALEEMK